MSLIHYVIVRNDLPLGILAAMVSHAAGESAHSYADPYDGRFRGATAVVLEVKDELNLHKVAMKLRDCAVAHVEIVEGAEPYANQLMAVGVVPGERKDLEGFFKGFQTLKTCYPAQEGPALQLLQRMRGWDHLATAADGLYWDSEIEKILASSTHVDKGLQGQVSSLNQPNETTSKTEEPQGSQAPATVAGEVHVAIDRRQLTYPRP